MPGPVKLRLFINHQFTCYFMKKIQTSIMVIAAIAGVSAAQAFKPAHRFLNPIQAHDNGDGTYTYFNTSGAPGSCVAGQPSQACTFSSTKTAGFFNTPANGWTSQYPGPTTNVSVNISPDGLVYKL